MQINDIFDLSQYDEAYKFVSENKGTTIEDLGGGQYKIVAIPTTTLEELKAQKRAERDNILQSTDKFMLSDYPITEEEKGLWIKYRKYLRDLPEGSDFPNVEVLTFEDWNK